MSTTLQRPVDRNPRVNLRPADPRRESVPGQREAEAALTVCPPCGATPSRVHGHCSTATCPNAQSGRSTWADHAITIGDGITSSSTRSVCRRCAHGYCPEVAAAARAKVADRDWKPYWEGHSRRWAAYWQAFVEAVQATEPGGYELGHREADRYSTE